MKLTILIIGLILVSLVEADLNQPAVPGFIAMFIVLLLSLAWFTHNDHDHFA